MFSPFDSSKTFDDKKFKNNTNFFFTSSTSQTMDFFNSIKEYTLDSHNNINHRLCMLKTLASIPVKDSVDILIDIIIKISEESNINNSLLYFFWSNQKSIFYFSDDVRHRMYELYFNKIQNKFDNIEIVLDICAYLLSKYGSESVVRQDALDFLVDITDDLENNSIELVYTAANILFTCGQPDEKFYGYKIMQKVRSENMINNSNSVNNSNKELSLITFKLNTDIEMEYYIFSKMYASLNALPISQKTIVLNSMKCKEKEDIDYFCFLHDCLDDVIREYTNIFDKEKIEEIYNSSISKFSTL
jgi:hypothetical protein